MNIKKICAIALLAASLILAIVSFILLPSRVITQFSISSSAVSSMPKSLAVILPSLLGIGFSAMYLFMKNETPAKNKFLIVSAVGVLVFVIMLFANL